jgi:sodium/proline symporter
MEKIMTEHTMAIAATFIVYLAAMMMIGYWAYRRTANSADYFLAGRSLGPWPTALSAGASDMSGWLMLGLPGFAFTSGLESLWLAGGLLLGNWLNWLLVARRLRVYTLKLDDSLTIPEYLSRRFQDKSGLIQTFSAIFILLFFLFYTSSGFVAGGKLFNTVFGMGYTTAVVVGALCVVSYTMFGGYLAVCWTDFVQGLMMAAALIIVPLVVIQLDGGFSTMFTTIHSINPDLLSLWNNAKGQSLTWITIASLAAWGLGYFGQPHILVRFASIRNDKEMPTARRIAIGWTAISMTGAILVGLAGVMYVHTNLGGKLADGEKIFMLLINALFNPIVAGILLSAILAAIMSTASSQLLVSSSALAEDIYKKLLRKDASREDILKVGRVGVMIITILSMLLALNPDSSVLKLVSYAWAGFGAAFGPAIILSLFWKRMNNWGAVAGIIVGGVTVVIYKHLTGGIFDLFEIIPGFILATIAIIVVSLMTEEPSPEIMGQFEEVEDHIQ